MTYEFFHDRRKIHAVTFYHGDDVNLKTRQGRQTMKPMQTRLEI